MSDRTHWGTLKYFGTFSGYKINSKYLKNTQNLVRCCLLKVQSIISITIRLPYDVLLPKIGQFIEQFFYFKKCPENRLFITLCSSEGTDFYGLFTSYVGSLQIMGLAVKIMDPCQPFLSCNCDYRMRSLPWDNCIIVNAHDSISLYPLLYQL